MTDFPQRVTLLRSETEKPYTWDYFLIFQYPDGSERKSFLERVAFGSFHISKYEFIQVDGKKVVSVYFEGNAAGQEYELWEHFDLSNGQKLEQLQFKKPWDLDDDRKHHSKAG